MEKQFELTDPESDLNKADMNEPLLVLRGNDALTAEVVRHYATLVNGGQLNAADPAKAEKALKLADDMDKWRSEKQK